MLMPSLDDRGVLHAHLFITGFVLVVCGAWMASIPDGAQNFIYDGRRDFAFEVALWLLRLQWFGVVVGGVFVVVLLVGRRRGWEERAQIKLCWITLAIVLLWFATCMYFLWPAMRVVFSAADDIFGLE
jgi:hypothetical protein